ncbi:MAG: DUF2911 domain-containing protein [Bdellovibrionales bacterium]|nr:DUF2911 domain-containing protein [Bdellovibrionales bacterium]
MRKNIFTYIASILLTSSLSVPVFAAVQLPALDKSPADISTFRTKTNDTIAKVIYGRPQVNQRKIFGDVVQYGKLWRTGANEATEVTFYKDVKVNETKITAGTYTLFTIPNQNQWTVILNKKLNQWGASTYDQTQDLLRFTVAPQTKNETVEAFTIAFEEGKRKQVDMVLAWENTLVTIPIQY